MPHALVIGGTKGLGRAIALAAAGRGLETVVTGRHSPSDSHQYLTYQPFFLGHAEGRDYERVISHADDPNLELIFIVAGSFLPKPIAESSRWEITAEFEANALGQIGFLHDFHRVRTYKQGPPYRLVVVSSTAAFKMQRQASVHAAAKAAMSAFARQFVAELVADLPGSTGLLVHPGRMQSGTHEPGTDISKLMDPTAVSGVIWGALAQQTPEEPYLELNVFRNPDGTPRPVYGPQSIETL